MDNEIADDVIRDTPNCNATKTEKETKMRVSEMYPGKFMKADVDVPEDENLVVTIDRVEMETVGQGDDATDKPVVYFKGMDKALVLNKTNANTIAKVLNTDDTDEWIGMKVTLFSTDVQFGADMVRAIRVRSKAPKKPAMNVQAEDESEYSPPVNGRGGFNPNGQASVHNEYYPDDDTPRPSDAKSLRHDDKQQWRALIATYTNMSVNGAIAALDIGNMLYSKLMDPQGPATTQQLEQVAAWLEVNGTLREEVPA